MYKTVPLNQLDAAAWDSFVDSSDEAWLWHRSDLIKILTHWPGRSDRSFAIVGSSDNEILAIVPMHLVKNEKFSLVSVKTLNVLGGPALKNSFRENQTQHIFALLINELINISKRENAMQIDFSLSSMAPAYRGEKSPIVNPLLRLGAKETSTQTYIIDLRMGKENVWKTFEKRARNAIRKAENMKINIRRANSTTDLQTYYNLHQTNYQRTGVRPHPITYFEGIWQDFYAKGLALILFAELNGEAVAAESFGTYKNGAIYWTGAASQTGLSVNANSLLQWSAINQFIDSGIEFYEVGEAFPEEQEGKKRGLDRFKRSFGGKLSPYFKSRFISDKLTYTLFEFWKSLKKSRQ